MGQHRQSTSLETEGYLITVFANTLNFTYAVIQQVERRWQLTV